ncbi:SUMF1/EgtB/PvdO family nonheme iron enzyme, partial [bacterium]|nr:SUMF1/EgtB/PvdO family nonheme iron enzyme [bacterium]
DDDLRRLLRARDAAPDDLALARRAAALASRRAERGLAAQAWQEVLRRTGGGDEEAETRLREVGCELVYRETDEHGVVEYENTVDRARLIVSPSLPALFVASRPVSYGQFMEFLVRRSGDPESSRWIGSHAPLRRPKGSDAWTINKAQLDYAALSISWLGADAYARWAGGRLLVAEEWDEVCYFVHGFEGFDTDFEEWVDGRDASGKRTTRHLLGGQRGFKEIEETAYPEDDTGAAVQFRYARSSWFRDGV